MRGAARAREISSVTWSVLAAGSTVAASTGRVARDNLERERYAPIERRARDHGRDDAPRTDAPGAPGTIGLMSGLGVVVDALRTHAVDGVSTNVAHVREDAMYVVFLAASVVGFGTLASGEAMSLSRRRDKARKALKECGDDARSVAKDEREERWEDGREGEQTDRRREGFLDRVGVPVARGVSHGAEPRGATLGGAVHPARHAHALDGSRQQGEHVLPHQGDLERELEALGALVFQLFGWIQRRRREQRFGYTESLITIELRAALTKRAHKMYMENNNFYKTAVLRQGGLDNVDQRIVADIDAFAKETAFLYGHSFKPILEFTLSLAEAAKELGYSPTARAVCVAIHHHGCVALDRARLGPMVAREAALEGGFRHTHSRLIAHAEEIALLDGGKREVEILDEGLDNLVVTQRWHALQRIRKSRRG